MTCVERVAPDEPDVAGVLARHYDLMRAQSPAESCHVLPANALAASDVNVFALRQDGATVAVGALWITGADGELKSMHTVAEHRGQGHGRIMLRGLIDKARQLRLERLYLETGSGEEHAAARALYVSEGFEPCGPFGSYLSDPLSVFMTRAL